MLWMVVVMTDTHRLSLQRIRIYSPGGHWFSQLREEEGGMYYIAHSIQTSGSRGRLPACSRRVLHLKRHRKWRKIYKCDHLQRHSCCLPCASRTERVKLQEGRESWSQVTHLEIILACVSGSSLSHVRSQV